MNMLIQNKLVGDHASTFMAFGGYYIFAVATFGILLVMDFMECQLHTLRLHWVEF